VMRKDELFWRGTIKILAKNMISEAIDENVARVSK